VATACASSRSRATTNMTCRQMEWQESRCWLVLLLLLLLLRPLGSVSWVSMRTADWTYCVLDVRVWNVYESV